jgi:hypothetical protein
MFTRTPGFDLGEAGHVDLEEVPRRNDIAAVEIDAEVEELFSRAVVHNFVPVVDSRGAFIGIVRRRAILERCVGLLGNR